MDRKLSDKIYIWIGLAIMKYVYWLKYVYLLKYIYWLKSVYLLKYVYLLIYRKISCISREICT